MHSFVNPHAPKNTCIAFLHTQNKFIAYIPTQTYTTNMYVAYSYKPTEEIW